MTVAQIAADLHAAIGEGLQVFQPVDETRTTRRLRTEGWCAREVLGHLIDSACNNHRRFVVGQSPSTTQFDSYNQNEWVARQHYDTVPWRDLVALWTAYNRHLAHVIASTPGRDRRACGPVAGWIGPGHHRVSHGRLRDASAPPSRAASKPARRLIVDTLEHLFVNNRKWSQRIKARDPNFFDTLAQQQSPKYLWIGCSDSRVPANEIVDLLPGELFVHRNVANVVVHTDLNCLSVLQYAVDVLAVEHVIVCGHYGCGGIRAALSGASLGLIDNWLRNVQDIRDRHTAEIDAAGDEPARVDRLCELNVSDAGPQRLPDHHRSGCLAAWAVAHDPRLGLFAAGWAAARPARHRIRCSQLSQTRASVQSLSSSGAAPVVCISR